MKNAPPQIEPMLQSSLPSHPWEKVGAVERFYIPGSGGLLFQVQKLTTITSAGDISALKLKPYMFPFFFHFGNFKLR